MTNGKAKCFGYNLYGQCGQNGAFATQRSIYKHFELGNNLPFIALDNKGLVLVSQVFAGGYSTCAITYTGTTVQATGKVKCWGDSYDFALGVLNATEYVGALPGQMGDALPYVNLGTALLAKSLALTWDVTCALLSSGKVKCWGRNHEGELGQGSTFGYTGTASDRFAMGDALPYVNLGSGVLVSRIAGGFDDFCILASAPTTHVGGVKCWGYGYYSQLGQINSGLDVGVAPNQMGDFLPWVPLGTVSGGKTKSPSKAVGRALADGEVDEKVRAQKQTRRALAEQARQERRKLYEERRVAASRDALEDREQADTTASAMRGFEAAEQ